MHIIIICLLAFQEAFARVCQDDQIVIELPNSEPFCESCPRCPPGSGTTLRCGTTVRVPVNSSQTCKLCTQGEYSDSFSTESCKTCSKCLPNEAVVAKCTNISNTRCSWRRCPHGFYRNQTTLQCVPCSECLDGFNEVVPQCVSQGIPRTQTCSYQKKKLSGPNCWYDEVTVLRSDGRHSCHPCPVCSKASGLTVPCGSIVPEESPVECERPIVGRTFVNQQGVLEPCSVCSPGQEVIQNCSSHLNTKCGDCKQGFYYNFQSKSCQECFWCCKHIRSDDVMKCIREGMLVAERHDGVHLASHFLVSSMKVVSQCAQSYHDYYPSRLLKADKLTFMLSFILLVFIYFRAPNFATVFGSKDRQGVQNPDIDNREEMKPKLQQPELQSDTTVEASQGTSSIDTKQVEPEYPAQKNPGHVIFRKTGVEVIAPTPHQLPGDLALETTSNSAERCFLEEGEIALSPSFAFVFSTELGTPVKVKIPHGANLVLSHEDWSISLKEFRNQRWINVTQCGPGEQGIKNVVAKSNHVSFETDHLSKFAVVGKLNKHSSSAFKRMKVAAFCSETSVGEDLLIRLYCFDDCEHSLERLTIGEKQEGRKLISSIDSLDFSVGSGKDVEITVKDTQAGWELDPASPTKIGYNLLLNSFDIPPWCDLVFHPTTEGNNTFFVLMALTHEPSFETVIYASTALKKGTVMPEIRNRVNGVQLDDGVKTNGKEPLETKELRPERCVIEITSSFS